MILDLGDRIVNFGNVNYVLFSDVASEPGDQRRRMAVHFAHGDAISVTLSRAGEAEIRERLARVGTER